MSPQKIILFDAVCPLCCWYTGVFEKCGWLAPGGRQPFAEGLRRWQAQVDPERARNEIPLIDAAGGPTLYSLDALTFLISQKHPRLAAISAHPWLRRPLGLLYQLISYNRRLIAGSAGCLSPAEGAPAFHRGWRLAWLALATGLTAACLTLPARSGHDTTITACALWLLAALSALGIQGLGWDRCGRWAAHLLMGGLLWSAVSLLPDSIPALAGGGITFALLTLDGRRRWRAQQNQPA